MIVHLQWVKTTLALAVHPIVYEGINFLSIILYIYDENVDALVTYQFRPQALLFPLLHSSSRNHYSQLDFFQLYTISWHQTGEYFVLSAKVVCLLINILKEQIMSPTHTV